jgi:hypothetical protein
MAGTSTGAPVRLAPTVATAPRLARLEAWLDAHPLLSSLCLYAVALGVRLLYLHDFRTGLLSQVPLMDEAYYRAEAWNRLHGAPAASDVEFMTPLYPWFLSWVFRLVGDGPVGPAAVQLVLGAFAAPLSFVVARRALRPILALLAGLAIATFAPVVFMEALYLVEGLVLLALIAALACAVARPGRAVFALSCGIALGVATLGRGSNLLLAVPLAVWFLVAEARCESRPVTADSVSTSRTRRATRRRLLRARPRDRRHATSRSQRRPCRAPLAADRERGLQPLRRQRSRGDRRIRAHSGTRPAAGSFDLALRAAPAAPAGDREPDPRLLDGANA